MNPLDNMYDSLELRIHVRQVGHVYASECCVVTAAAVDRTFSHTDKINASHRCNSESDRSTPSGSSSCVSSVTKTSNAGETGLSS